MIPQVPIPDGYRLRDIQLEMSLKPFYDTSPGTREAVCREMFEQWRTLARHAETVSVLLWVGDGSEMLEYEGDLSKTFEWGRYQGSANAHEWRLSRKATAGSADEQCTGIHAWDEAHDPGGVGLHRRAYLYRPQPAEFTFAWLAELVARLKVLGRELLGRPVRVGETFDIGPEFAVSRFKYAWHPEILAGGNSLFKGQFISCEAVLRADNRCYAGFPSGIPEGTTLGTFLGRQARCFFRDIGFDFLWLSNGFGFALEPWALVGTLFDGMRFHPDAAAGTRERILRFWKDLRAEFPPCHPIRTRGTNLCTGIDLGSDASPLRDIYSPELATDAPVNSPWAAIDGDFGLELSGWMSHIARHPGDTFRFRYYIHDPWWKNSPFLDRYERYPHDLYLPASVSRLTAAGGVEIARDIAFLSVDDSDGRMPPCVPAEVSAHLLRAREFAPDDAGPLVWAYPFDDFHEAVDAGRPQVPFHADLFVGTAINDAVPLNTVADLGELDAAIRARPSLPAGRVFLSPVPRPGSASEATLTGILDRGGSLLLYGPVPEGSAFLAILGLRLAPPVEGDFAADLRCVPPGERPMPEPTIRHTAFLSAGGWREVPGNIEPAALIASGRRGDATRAAAVVRETGGGGRAGWVRGSLATAEFDPGQPAPIRGPILLPMDPARFLPCGRLARHALHRMGWSAAVADTASASRPPYYTVHRHRHAFHFSGHHVDEYADLRLRSPLGAPLFTGRRVHVRDGATVVTGERAWSYEARVFVESGGDGIHRCRIQCPVGFGVCRRLLVSGCRAAALNFLIDPASDRPPRFLRRPVFPYLVGDFVEPAIVATAWGDCARVPDVDGTLLIEW